MEHPKLTPLYLMPGTHVTVRMFDGTLIFRFKVQGRSDGTYRAIGFNMPRGCDIGDIRRWLGGRRLKGGSWESNPTFPQDPVEATRALVENCGPLTRESSAFPEGGYLTTPTQAKRHGGQPINKHIPLMLDVSVADLVQVEQQEELRGKAPRCKGSQRGTTSHHPPRK